MPEAPDYSGEWYLPIGEGVERLYVLERGDGPLLLAVHGGPGHDHSYLLDALGPLEARHRVVYFDQRGSLRSPMPLDRVSLDAVIDDFARLVGELGGGPLRAIAHSMGCVVTAAAIDRYPQLFGEVLLVNPGPLRAGQGFPPAEPTRSEVDAELARLGLDREPLTAKETTWAWRIRFAGVNLYHVDRWHLMGGGQVFYNSAVGRAVSSGLPDGYDYLPALQRHAHAVTIAVGDHDFVDPGGEHARAAAVGAVRTLVVERAGHNLWIDQPERFLEITEQAFP